jgi:phosphoglycerate dehydrogenase-like enzyme
VTTPDVPRTLVVDLRAKARVWRIPASLEQELIASAPAGWNVVVVQSDTVSDGDGGHPPSQESLAAIENAEVYFGYGITRQLFLPAKRLRWIHTSTAGVGSTLFDELRESRVLLTNSAGVHAVPMAEYVLGGLLHFWRGFDITMQSQRKAVWSRDPFIAADSPVREVGEATVLIVGTGGIGTELATRLRSLGATCVGIRRRPELGLPRGFSRVTTLDGLDAELPGADALVLAAPLTPATRGLITAARLDLLPRHAVVANVARGAMLDETALAARLAASRLRGAVLDVFHTEPLAPDSPLWQLRRALVTPHVSAVTPRRFWEREGALFRDNWNRYVMGAPLRNLVNKDAGY